MIWDIPAVLAAAGVAVAAEPTWAKALKQPAKPFKWFRAELKKVQEEKTASKEATIYQFPARQPPETPEFLEAKVGMQKALERSEGLALEMRMSFFGK